MIDDKQAQEQIDKVIDPEKSAVEENPISEVDAKKFAGLGDYSLPVSPLDNLTVPTEGTEAKQQVEKSAQPQPEVDLEKKAKDMLEKLDEVEPTSGGKKPKKKRSGAATKMALAAVLMVLMGAGGIVGVNLFKINQTTEDRSQATGNVGETCTEDQITDCLRRCELELTQPNCPYSCAGICTGTVSCAWPKDKPTVSCKRCHCCDGNWISSTNSCSDVCAGNGGEWGNCTTDDVDVDKCGCDSWSSDGCGVNCKFSNADLAELDARVNNAACGEKFILDCNVSLLEAKVVKYDPNNKCHTDAALATCNNPSKTKVCDNESVFKCNSIGKEPNVPVIGNEVVFTCAGTGEVDHYEYQYKIGAGAFMSMESNSLTIAAAGDYVVQCRACQSTDSSDCTVWGLADK